VTVSRATWLALGSSLAAVGCNAEVAPAFTRSAADSADASAADATEERGDAAEPADAFASAEAGTSDAGGATFACTTRSYNDTIVGSNCNRQSEYCYTGPSCGGPANVGCAPLWSCTPDGGAADASADAAQGSSPCDCYPSYGANDTCTVDDAGDVFVNEQNNVYACNPCYGAPPARLAGAVSA
jgi:hypothetical protein